MSAAPKPAAAASRAPQAGGQDRLPPLSPDAMTPAQREAAGEFEKLRGRAVFGPFVPLHRSPELMLRAAAMGEYLRYRSALPRALGEFAILIAARQWSQQYEWHHHRAFALEAGLAPAIVAALAEGRRPEGMSEAEATVHDFSLELHRNRSVSDATYGRALALLGEQGVVDLVGLAGYYSLLGMVMNVARTPLPAGATPELPPLPG
jgi:4-carboxymuconolactone decarboxylase